MNDPFLVVDNRELRLVFWPSCGGRLISAAIDGVELLWRNPEFLDADGLVRPRESWTPLDTTMGSWANVGGSKTWPAPQGWSGAHEWPGPPDEVLDSGAWTAERLAHADGSTTVIMTSQADPRTGLRVERCFAVPATGRTFSQRTRFTNTHDRRITWSIWEVCQVDTRECYDGGRVRVGVDGDEPPVVQFRAFGEPDVGTLHDRERHIPVQRVVGKLGLTDANRFVRLDRPDGASVEIAFDAQAGAVYPDGGSRVELWLQYPLSDPLSQVGGLHPRADYLELEVLGPLVTLHPGESTDLSLGWTLRSPRAAGSRPSSLSSSSPPAPGQHRVHPSSERQDEEGGHPRGVTLAADRIQLSSSDGVDDQA